METAFNEGRAGDRMGKARQERGVREEKDRTRERVRRTKMREKSISNFQGEGSHL